MVFWTAVPFCPICGETMNEDSDEDWECHECGNVIYGEDLID